jgi:hypothetical protein
MGATGATCAANKKLSGAADKTLTCITQGTMLPVPYPLPHAHTGLLASRALHGGHGYVLLHRSRFHFRNWLTEAWIIEPVVTLCAEQHKVNHDCQECQKNSLNHKYSSWVNQ